MSWKHITLSNRNSRLCVSWAAAARCQFSRHVGVALLFVIMVVLEAGDALTRVGTCGLRQMTWDGFVTNNSFATH